jgi:hypothetical protein
MGLTSSLPAEVRQCPLFLSQTPFMLNFECMKVGHQGSLFYNLTTSGLVIVAQLAHHC